MISRSRTGLANDSAYGRIAALHPGDSAVLTGFLDVTDRQVGDASDRRARHVLGCVFWDGRAVVDRNRAVDRSRPALPTICSTIWPMGRREVLVQLDDDLVERLDRLAQAQNTSRSELLRRGASAVIEAAEQLDADRLLRDAYRRVPQDPALVASARRLAAETAPEW